MIPVIEFAKAKGLSSEKVIESIRDGRLIGRKVDQSWFVDAAYLWEEPKREISPQETAEIVYNFALLDQLYLPPRFRKKGNILSTYYYLIITSRRLLFVKESLGEFVWIRLLGPISSLLGAVFGQNSYAKNHAIRHSTERNVLDAIKAKSLSHVEFPREIVESIQIDELNNYYFVFTVKTKNGESFSYKNVDNWQEGSSSGLNRELAEYYIQSLFHFNPSIFKK